MFKRGNATTSRPKVIAGIICAAVLLAASAGVFIYSYNDHHANIGGGLFRSGYKCRTDVTGLCLTDTGLDNIKGVGRCKALETLDLENMGLDDVSEAAECKTLKSLDLCGNDVSAEEYDELRAALPECDILWDVPLGGIRVRSDSESVDLANVPAEAYGLIEKYLPGIKSADASAVPLSAELSELYRALPDCSMSWNVDIGGSTVDCSTEKLDFNDVRLDDFENFRQQLAYLPALRKVELCRSGFSDEQMEQLMETYPEIKFVWEIYIGEWNLRTDVTSFSTANNWLPKPAPEEWYKLRYLTDLVALDVGHQNLPEPLDYMSGLTNLRSIILWGDELHDLSPLASCVNIEFVELQHNKIDNIEIVRSWPHLKEINLCYCQNITDPSPLYECKELKRCHMALNPKINTPEFLAEYYEKFEGVDMDMTLVSSDGKHAREAGLSWRPINYRSWGFQYDHPYNTPACLNIPWEYDHSTANVDSTPKDDD